MHLHPRDESDTADGSAISDPAAAPRLSFGPDELAAEYGVHIDLFVEDVGSERTLRWWAQKTCETPFVLQPATGKFHLEALRDFGRPGGWPRREHFFPSWRAAAIGAVTAVNQERNP